VEGQYDGRSDDAQGCRDCDYPAHFEVQLHRPFEGYWAEFQAYILNQMNI
jgi:hypothetical protein